MDFDEHGGSGCPSRSTFGYLVPRTQDGVWDSNPDSGSIRTNRFVAGKARLHSLFKSKRHERSRMPGPLGGWRRRVEFRPEARGYMADR